MDECYIVLVGEENGGNYHCIVRHSKFSKSPKVIYYRSNSKHFSFSTNNPDPDKIKKSARRVIKDNKGLENLPVFVDSCDNCICMDPKD